MLAYSKKQKEKKKPVWSALLAAATSQSMTHRQEGGLTTWRRQPES